MDSKRGQITPIIIVAIVIGIGFGIYYMLPGQIGVDDVDPSVEPIHSFVQGCLQEVTGDAILQVSDKGGYFIYPQNILDNGVPYYLYDGKNYQPTKERVELELASYIEDQLFFCLNDFEDFPSYNVERISPKSEVRINSGKVNSRLNFPLTISRGKEVYQLENFEVDVDARLDEILEAVDFFMEDQMEHQESLCLFCGHDISTTYNFEFTTVNIDEGILVGIKDKDVLVNDKEVLFAFANKLERLL